MSDFSTPELRPAEPPDETRRIYRGESMLGVFVPGDLLRVEKLTAAQVEVGDIIVFDSPRGGVTVHRAIERTKDGGLRTMGDNNPAPDINLVAPDAVIFRVVEVRRGDGGTAVAWFTPAARAARTGTTNRGGSRGRARGFR